MDNNMRGVEVMGGAGSQIYTTLCVNLLSVRLVTENYDNLMAHNKTERARAPVDERN